MSYKILLVEDNPHIMEINHEALMMADYEVLEAFDGKQCMDQLKSGDVDLVVLDIMLPDSDGVTLCRQIKKEYDVPILFRCVARSKRNTTFRSCSCPRSARTSRSSVRCVRAATTT